MQGSGHFGGGGGGRQYERMLRHFMFVKNPLGMLAETSWQPPTDVFDTDTATIVRMEIPGVSPDTIEILFSDDVLTILGVREDCTAHEKIAIQQLEIHCGDFRRDIPLRYSVDFDATAAKYEKGFLTIEMPRARHEKAVSAFRISITFG